MLTVRANKMNRIEFPNFLLLRHQNAMKETKKPHLLYILTKIYNICMASKTATKKIREWVTPKGQAYYKKFSQEYFLPKKKTSQNLIYVMLQFCIYPILDISSSLYAMGKDEEMLQKAP